MDPASAQPAVNAASVSTVGWSALEQFEQAWRRGAAPDLASFWRSLAASETTLLRRLIAIDIDFRFQAGTDIRLEDYVLAFPDLGHDRAALLELLGVEYESRRRAGQSVTFAELAVRFPMLGEDTIRTHLELATLYQSPRKSAAIARSAVLPNIPGYQVLAPLGHGGMGLVYRARHLTLKRDVALKVMLDTRADDAHGRQRFRVEAEAFARLQHPNIVQIFEVGEHDGAPYFCLELVEGGTLAAKIAGEPRPAHEAAAIVEALARAMHVAHRAGIIHRDLKPSNVLLATDGTPKIADFGLAKKLEESGLTTTGVVLGTPSYMAPEQAAGKTKEISPRADVYSLGAILYEMLTGRPPFRGESQLDTIKQVVEDEPTPPRRLNPRAPREVETICLKCLHKKAHERYASAEELAEDLRRFQAGEPIRARRAGALARGWKWARRRPAASAVIALTVALAASLGAGGLLWEAADRERREEARVQRAKRRHASEIDNQMALQELHNGQFARADALLRQAIQRLEQDEHEEATRAELQTRQERIQRLVKFYELADACERLIFEQRAEPALAAGEAAWRSLKLDAHEEEWWRHLPDADLTPEQRAALQDDVFRSLHFVGALHGLQGLTKFFLPESPVAFRACLQRLSLATRFRESRSAEVMKKWARFGLGEPDAVRPLPPGEPKSAVDHYFWGLAHLAVVSIPDHPAAQSLVGAEGLLGDLDRANALPTAERHLRLAVHLQPKHFYTNIFLVVALATDLRFDEAELAATIAIGLRPKDATGYVARSGILEHQARKALLPEQRAILLDRAYQDAAEAVRFEPKSIDPYNNLGHVLLERRRPAEAAELFRKAIAIEPEEAKSHLWLGRALIAAGLFTEAQQATQQALDFSRGKGSVGVQARHQMKRCQSLLRLDQLLPTVLAAKDYHPETVALAAMCTNLQKRHLAAVRLYERAFHSDARLAGKPDELPRFQAARAAALAALGQGQDALTLTASEQAALALKARDWLRAELAMHQLALRQGTIVDISRVADRLSFWRLDRDLDVVRTPQELANLADDERQGWLELWSEVERTLAEARGRFREERHVGRLGPQQDQRIHALTLDSACTYELEIVDDGFGGSIKLQTTQGTTVAAYDKKNLEQTRSRLTYRPSQSATYRLVVTPANSSGYGLYTLRVREFKSSPTNARGPG